MGLAWFPPNSSWLLKCDLDNGQQVYIENQGSRTMITLVMVDRASKQSQEQLWNW